MWIGGRTGCQKALVWGRPLCRPRVIDASRILRNFTNITCASILPKFLHQFDAITMDVAQEEEKRRIKLFCPSASKLIQIVAADEQKLDLGSIARAFGLDPTTLKLNGHFISRGVDLIASSVTWKSLIGFFSARGLSTGASDSDALLVDGKLSKIGSKKRSHSVEDTGNGILDMSRKGCCTDNKKPQVESINSAWVYLTKSQTSGCNNLWDLKRKWCLEDESLAKKRRKPEQVVSRWKGILSCSFISKTMKRMRGEDEDGEMGAASAPIKKSKMIQPP